MNHIIEKNSPLILVADDDSSTRILLRLVLENDGYQVKEVENGEQCIAAYQQQRPDLILLDGVMPGMNGFVCCRQLKSMPMGDRTPVLMITGLDDRDSVDRAFESGAIDYVTKPIHPPVLIGRLRRILEAAKAEEALRESEKKYRSVVTNLKETIFQTDPAGKLTLINPAWTNMTGFSLEESLDRNFLEFIYPPDRLQHLAKFKSLIQGESKVCRYEIRYFTISGSFGWMEVSAYPIFGDKNDRPIGIFGTLNNITDRKEREKNQRIEYVATQILAESVTLKEAASKVLLEICTSLGWAVGEFWQLDPKENVLRCQETRYLQGQFLDFQRISERMVFEPERGLPGKILASGEPLWIFDLLQKPDFHKCIGVAKTGLKGAFGFPILNNKEKLGVMIFFNRNLPLPNSDSIAVLSGIGKQFGQFIKRKQAEEELQRQNLILQSELNQAAEYVQSLLPTPLNKFVSIEQQFIPSLQLGGDIFDYYWLDNDNLVIYLLDVSGHGVRSALLSISLLNLLRSQSLNNTNFYQPQTVLKELNRLFQINENGDDYFTIWYGVYNRLERRLLYACAGHPPAISIDDSSIQELSTPNIPIGILPEADFTQNVCEILPNSTLYIFSDGVYEIMHSRGEIWGFEAFVDSISTYHRQHRETSTDLKTILEHIQTINKHQPFNDDFSLLKITFT